MFNRTAPKPYVAKEVTDSYYTDKLVTLSPLYQAVLADDFISAKAILADRKNAEHVNQAVGLYNTDTPLFAAVRRNNLLMVQLLVGNGANPYQEIHYRDADKVEDDKTTPAKFAAERGYVGICVYFRAIAFEAAEARKAMEARKQQGEGQVLEQQGRHHFAALR